LGKQKKIREATDHGVSAPELPQPTTLLNLPKLLEAANAHLQLGGKVKDLQQAIEKMLLAQKEKTERNKE
jgi:hypothetical protein